MTFFRLAGDFVPGLNPNLLRNQHHGAANFARAQETGFQAVVSK
jgi:hypothetical protein